jgi:hypothetical protein
MVKFALLCGMAIGPCTLAGQATDTITLSVGHPSVDGRIYKAHWATATITTEKAGKVVRSFTYWNHTYRTQRDGVPVCIVESLPMPDGSDSQFYALTVLDLRTTALRHVEERDGTGRFLMADIDGAHVTGRFRASHAAAEERLDFTLDAPSYYEPFADAAIGATQIRKGQVWRVPTFAFDPAARHTTWHTFHIVGRETVPAKDGRTDAWIVEDDASAPTKIWITYVPPYLPQELDPAADGAVERFTSSVVDAPRGRLATSGPK